MAIPASECTCCSAGTSSRDSVRPESVTHVSGMNCHPCVRNRPSRNPVTRVAGRPPFRTCEDSPSCSGLIAGTMRRRASFARRCDLAAAMCRSRGVTDRVTPYAHGSRALPCGSAGCAPAPHGQVECGLGAKCVCDKGALQRRGVSAMNTTRTNGQGTSSLSADEVLDHVRRLYKQLQQLRREPGTTQHVTAYAALEAEIRVWADRYTQISGARTDRRRSVA
jgi:hypothetical protein